MTIEVSITNKDQAKTITVSFVELDKATGSKTETFAAEFAPGTGGSLHCHLLRDIVIREVKP